MRDGSPPSDLAMVTLMDMDEKPAPKRGRCQYSLRTLLAAVLAAGVSLGWIGSWVEQLRTERRVVSNLSESAPEAAYCADGHIVSLRITGSRGGR